MTRVLLIGPDRNIFFHIENTLKKNDFFPEWIDSGVASLSKVSDSTYHLAITDEKLSDMSGLDFIKKLITVNPMINSAAISTLSSEDFHEASEGLGVLMQLPERPDERDAETLLSHLGKITGQLRKKEKIPDDH